MDRTDVGPLRLSHAQGVNATATVATPPSAVSAPDPSGSGLQLIGLTKRYGDLTALRDCSLSVRPGRVLGLLGPNGAGKTTAMRCIFGIVAPDGGEVFWNGAPVDHELRLRFGYMPEERGLYPQMGVRDQLEYLARLSGLSRPAAVASVDHWLRRLEIADRGESRLIALSHGNQQRVQLAAALVHDPVALLLDEPFAGLDPLGVDALSAVIAELAQEGVAVLFSSHQLDLVQHVCQDVVVIAEGQVVLTGELDALRFSSERRFLEVAFREAVDWAPALPGTRVLLATPGQTRLELAGEVDIDSLLRSAQHAGELARFALEPPSLSDLFHEAVAR